MSEMIVVTEAMLLANAHPKKSWAKRWMRAKPMTILEPAQFTAARAKQERKFVKGACVTTEVK